MADDENIWPKEPIHETSQPESPEKYNRSGFVIILIGGLIIFGVLYWLLKQINSAQ